MAGSYRVIPCQLNNNKKRNFEQVNFTIINVILP
jgi:hypothetical protein